MKSEDIKTYSDNLIDSYKGIPLPPNLKKANSPFGIIYEHQRTKKLKLFTKYNEKNNFERIQTTNFVPNKLQLNLVNTLRKVRIFIETLKFRMGYKNYKNLKTNHLNIINDMAAFQFNHENSDLIRNSNFKKKIKLPILKKIKEKFHNIKLKIPVFSRNNKWLIIWDALIFIFSIFFLIIIPIIFCFDNQGQNIFIDEYDKQVEEIAKAIFTIDFILKFNISYHDHGNEVKEKKKIIENYIKSDFIFDFLSLVGIYSDGYSFLKLFVLLKIISFSEYIHVVSHLIILNDFAEGVIKIIILMSKIIYIAHILACLFNLVSNELIKRNYSNSSWIIDANLIDKPWTEKYFNAFYWAIATLATVGYGDIVPKNNIEKIFCIVVMLIGSGIFAYNINKLSNIFGDISKNEREYLKNLKVLNQMMKRKKLNSELQNKVRNYFHYMYKKENKKQIEEENQLFNKLSQGLQKEIILNSYASVLKQSKFVCNNFSEEFLQSIVFKMKSKVCMPDEEIFVRGEIDSNMYFLTQGKARIYFGNKRKEKEEKAIYDVTAGETLCEMNLIVTEEYKYCCKTTDFCTFYTISLKDFLQALHNFPEDKEKYQMIKDSILLYKNYEYFYKKCKLCNSTFHLTEKCNYVTFQAHQEKILYKLLLENRDKLYQRKGLIRRSRKLKRYHIPEINSIFESSYQNPRLSSQKRESTSECREIKILDGANENRSALFPTREYDTFEKGEIILLKSLVHSQPLIDLNYKNLFEHNDSSCLDTNDNNPTKITRLESRNNNNQIDSKNDLEKGRKKKSIYIQEPLFNFSFETWKNFEIYFPYNNFKNLMRKYRIHKDKEDEIDFMRTSTRKKSITKAQKRLFKSDYLNEK